MTVSDVPAVGLREPCPCGSGKRYKNCHGREREEAVFVARPFAGITGEADIVAMLELLASATAETTLAAGHGIPGGTRLTIGTVLPGGSSAFRAADDHIIVGLQTSVHSADRSADIACAVATAAQADTGEFIAAVPAPAGSVRLDSMLAPGTALHAAIHDDFQWWADAGIVDIDEDEDAEFLAEMNSSFTPATRLSVAAPAFYLPMVDRPQVRMVLADDEAVATDAFARLLAAGQESVGEGSKWLGNFRTCGLLAPVWDVPQSWTAGQADTAVAEFIQRYTAAARTTDSLSPAQRRSRAVVTGKFVTLR